MGDSEHISSVPYGTVKKPGYVMIKGMPCKIGEVTLKAKATSKGNDRLYVAGHHWKTGKKYEDTINLTVGTEGCIQVPNTSRKVYEVMDVDPDNGTVSVLTSSGEVKDDLNLPKALDGSGHNEVAKDLIEKFENGDDLKVTVLTIMGEETVIEVP